MLSPSRFKLLLVASLVFGALYRLFPLMAGPDAVSEFFITEDGYLMLTVARNLAIGNGLSVSDATIATNGIQPLATFLYAIPFVLTGGAKVASLYGVVFIMAVLSVGSAFAVFSFARAVFTPAGRSPVWAICVATLWFVGPLALLHSMNALETGFYVGMVAFTLLVFGQICARGGRYTGRDQLILGLLCGVTFLVRIDAAFLLIILFAVRLLYMPVSGQLSIRDAILEAIPPGLLTIAIAAPWLLHNQIYFGSIMPISGTAQSMSAGFGQNAAAVPSRLIETMLPMLPIPRSLELNPALIIVSVAAVTLVLARFLWRITRSGHPMRVAIWTYTIFGASIVGYYGLSFGAEHFLSRYFAPLAPLFIVAAIWVLLDLVRSREQLAYYLAAASVVLCVALLVRLAIPGMKEQGHFQVVRWIHENVAEETWVAAVQTGTLGYWHDRSINLDGKVNPEALQARLTEGNVLNYVVDSKIDILADRARIAGWVERNHTAFAEAFEVVVEDKRQNLGVLRRREPSQIKE